jgi:hypothetical protein
MQGMQSQQPIVVNRREQRAAVRTLTLRWSISKPAAVALGLACERDASVSLEVSVELHGDSTFRVGEVAAALRAGERSQEFEVEASGPGVCITDAETGLTHVDVPGVLQVSLRLAEPEKPLFARTTLLSSMGVAGGRYEFLGGSLTP